MSISSAIKIIQKLHDKGFKAYFAGGWVRDYLMKTPCDDIDIATEASIEQIIDIFPHTIPVGANFGIVVVVVEGEQFEVATFRKESDYIDGRHPSYVEKATPEEDALRRSLTINGMFYDPLSNKIYDYVGGEQDLKNKIIRTIGEPCKRFQEDRLRMIRAVRFASRWPEFKIEENTKKAISKYADQLFPAVSMERIWQEFNKMVKDKHFDYALTMMYEFGLLQQIFPELKEKNINFIKDRVKSYSQFPDNTPTILYLAELFPKASDNQLLEIAYKLKTSKRDRKYIETMVAARSILSDTKAEMYHWAHFYAEEDSELCLNIIASNLDEEQKHDFLKYHSLQRNKIKTAIERIRTKKPLVSAKILCSEGIKPGPLLGQLLQEAEKISINESIDDYDIIIKKLKLSPLWP